MTDHIYCCTKKLSQSTFTSVYTAGNRIKAHNLNHFFTNDIQHTMLSVKKLCYACFAQIRWNRPVLVGRGISRWYIWLSWQAPLYLRYSAL